MSIEMEAVFMLGIFAGFMAVIIYAFGDGLDKK